MTEPDFGEFAAPGGSDVGSALPTPLASGGSLGAPDPCIATHAEPKKLGWIGRGAALLAAAALVGGGAYFALTAAGDDGGAESPEAAVEQLFAALSAEDMLGAAELVDPAERDTLVEAGFDLVEELQRLEVLAEDMDLGAVPGINLDFADVALDVEMVRSDLAQVHLRGGTFSVGYQASELPLGSLVTDRVSDEWLQSSDTVTDSMVDDTIAGVDGTDNLSPFIATVEHGGRWYVSLWYTVGEYARSSAGEPLPAASSMPAAVGAGSPEGAVRAIVERAEVLDVRGVIGMLDPVEAAALYQYSPLFLTEAETGIAEFLDAAQREGYAWGVHTLDLAVDEDGDSATVTIDNIGFSLEGPEFALKIDIGGDQVSFETAFVDWDGSDVVVRVETVESTTTTYEQDGETTDSTEVCADEALSAFGLSPEGLMSSGLVTTAVGVETQRVDGVWYVSPTRTMTAALLAGLRAWDAETLGKAVDNFVDATRDPFAFDDPFGDALGAGDSSFEPGEAPLPVPAPLPPAQNTDLLVAAFTAGDFIIDISRAEASAEFGFWLPDFEAPNVERGVLAEMIVADGFVDVYVFETASSDVANAYVEQVANAPGVEVRGGDDAVHYVATDSFGDPVAVAADGARLVIVGSFGLPVADLSDHMATQLAR